MPQWISRLQKQGMLVPAILIIALTIGIYAHSLGNGFVNLDDPLLVTENPAVQSLTPASLKTVFTSYDPELYIPLTFVTYQIEYALFGLNATVFHVTNLLLHVLNALLVLWIIFLFSRSRFAAVFCAVLFAVHPLNAETVAWIAARKDILSAFFFLLSLGFFLLYRERPGARSYVVSIVAFLCALLSKVMAITLPVLLLMIAYREKGKITRRDLKETAPYFLLSILFGIVALFGKTNIVPHTTPFENMLIAAKSMMYYLQKIFVPVRLSVIYSYTENVSLSSPDFFVPLLALLLLLIVIAVSLRRTRHIAFAAASFFLLLSPTFITFWKGSVIFFASDRYAYLASLVVFLFVGALVQKVLARRPQWTMIFYVVYLAVVTIFIILTYRRSMLWSDSITFNEDILKKYPNSYHAEYNLGKALEESGNPTEAANHYVRALEIFPGHPDALLDLGLLYAEEHGNDESAVKKFIETTKMLPNHPRAWHNLGVLHQVRGEWDEAIAAYMKALEIDSDYSPSRKGLAETYGKKGMFAEGIEQYRILWQRDPAYARNAGLTPVE